MTHLSDMPNSITLTAEARAKRLRCVIFDIDGVMTDCKLYLAADGSEIKAVNVRDGLGIKLLMKHGIEVAVISGRPSEAMAQRLAFLGVKYVWLNTEEKLPAFESLLKTLGIAAHECAHMGDDIPDLPLFARVGLAIAPGDAHAKAKAAAQLVTQARGGDGAIREAVDFILQAQGKG